MTVDEPLYYLSWGEAELEIRGEDEVREFYQGLMDARAEVMTITDSMLTVDDEGLWTFLQYHNFRHGEDLIAEGSDVEDPDGHYIVHYRTLVYYMTDEQGRLVG